MTVRTRFAPSPTGYLHIGGARTALFSWLFARKHGGKFVLRIEDTDLQRSTAESVNAILEGMTWLGLEYDEGPFYQTQRFDRFSEAIDELLTSGHAYRCACSKECLEDLRARQMAIRPRYAALIVLLGMFRFKVDTWQSLPCASTSMVSPTGDACDPRMPNFQHHSVWQGMVENVGRIDFLRYNFQLRQPSRCHDLQEADS